MLVARSLELAERLKQGLDKLEYCRVLNRDTLGASVNWWVLPKGRNANQIFQQLIEGNLPAADRERYFGEIKQLRLRREKTMDPALDAKLGYTTNYGFKPLGIEIPAWKAVFFNPKTTDEMVDRMIYSIEERT